MVKVLLAPGTYQYEFVVKWGGGWEGDGDEHTGTD
jgi:hypothetical protein